MIWIHSADDVPFELFPFNKYRRRNVDKDPPRRTVENLSRALEILGYWKEMDKKEESGSNS